MEGGAKTIFSRGVRKLVRPVVTMGTLVFTACDLRQPFPERRIVPGITIREATIDDANLFEDKATFLERLNAGHRCFMGIEEATGKLTNCRWISTSNPYIPELQRYLILEPVAAYAYDLKTMPEFRKRGIDAYTRHFAYSHLRDTGHTKVYAYIHGDNHPSLQASRRFLKPIGRVVYVQLRGCNPWMIYKRGPDFPEFKICP